MICERGQIRAGADNAGVGIPALLGGRAVLRFQDERRSTRVASRP